MLGRLFWGSGGTLHHPQPGLDAFAAFEFPDDLLDSGGLFKPIKQITHTDKANMLSGTFAKLHGLDIVKLKQGIEGDEFESAKARGFPTPYSTLSHMTHKAQPAAGDTIYA